MMKEFVEMRDVRKIYRMGEVEIAAADGIDFQIKKGEFAVVVGPSGAGKRQCLTFWGEWIRQQVERSGSMERIL